MDLLLRTGLCVQQLANGRLQLLDFGFLAGELGLLTTDRLFQVGDPALRHVFPAVRPSRLLPRLGRGLVHPIHPVIWIVIPSRISRCWWPVPVTQIFPGREDPAGHKSAGRSQRDGDNTGTTFGHVASEVGRAADKVGDLHS
ncbi:hypothetical protein [Fodinicola feengrottensis]|uniref:hypothetical protein n=1 Tax=Fodinicola feengrottensis TaxID=435914 RepID=UPI0013D2208A|nr:hypothetical protein [Fodinicola feengrottensis]